jgi:hypothetical protein
LPGLLHAIEEAAVPGRDLRGLFLRGDEEIEVTPIRSFAPAIGALLLVAANVPALAEIQVQGPAADVRLEAHEATVTEILAVLAQRFDLRVRGAGSSRRVTATFQGPLRRVVTRVLDGCDYVVRSRSQGAALDVLVLNEASSSKPVMPSPVMVARGRAH